MPKKFVIVGGGAAGIAAAATLLKTSPDASVTLFEANGYYGGRAHTDSKTIRGLPFDMGAVYLQDPGNNPWTAIAASLNFETVDDNTTYEMRIDRGHGFETISTTGDPHVTKFDQQITSDYKKNKSTPNARVMSKPRLDTQDQWFGLAISTYGPFVESAEPWQYLAADRARENQGPGNLFVKKGLGKLVAKYGAGLKDRFGARYSEYLDTPVDVITHDPSGVSVRSADGRTTVAADACIVTVPVSVLGAGAITFTPALPKPYTTALRALRLGSYKKIAVELARLPSGIDDDANYYLYNDDPDGIWQFYRLSFYPANVLVAHASGDFAAALDDMKDADVFNAFKSALSEAYDTTVSFRAAKAMTNWTKDPYAMGAYSYTAFIGGGPDDRAALGARDQMAAPLGRVLFAGEALDLEAYGTLQGAYATGEAAAGKALQLA